MTPQEPKRMTIEQRAKLIRENISFNIPTESERELQIAYIILQLSEAREEGFKAGMEAWQIDCNSSYEKGFSDAREMAAKVAEIPLAPTEYAEQYSIAIAEHICAMKPGDASSPQREGSAVIYVLIHAYSDRSAFSVSGVTQDEVVAHTWYNANDENDVYPCDFNKPPTTNTESVLGWRKQNERLSHPVLGNTA